MNTMLPPTANATSPTNIERLSALLEAAEARADAANAESENLRRENASLTSAIETSSRLLNNLRSDYDRLKTQETPQRQPSDECVSLAETARLRSQVGQLEREVVRLNQRADDSDKRYVGERRKCVALERVCMDLRRRVALAEEKAVDGKRVEEAVLAREVAEAELAEIKVEMERWRAKCSAVEVMRERADVAERAERVQRERVGALEREVESRERLLREAVVERNKLRAYLGKYERELEEKERKVGKLKMWIREGRGGGVRRRRGGSRALVEEEELEELMRDGEGEGEQGGSHEGTIDGWENDVTATTGELEAAVSGEADEGVSFAEASPLLREVELLQATFKDSVGGKAGGGAREKLGGEKTDLMERVQRLEASFDAIAKNRKAGDG
eukprot:GFKZ01012077.1.p1 GENE.GFKZ01012077.1~~GFKZ01012077.1.p1  ORF type:complete len:389 (+),score=95.56 GFKZ01012077.1:151-1317(+)